MRAFVHLVSLVAISLTAACTLGPDPGQPPTTVADSAQAFVNAPDGSLTDLPSDDWWRRFADPVTTELVEAALANSPDIRAAGARVLQARAAVRAAGGARLPQADLSVSGSRTKSSFVLPQTGRVGIYSTTFSENLQVSYQVDLFGRLSRAEQAAWSRLAAGEADRRAVANTLIAQVIRGRVTTATLQRRLQLARSTLSSWEQTATLVEDRYRAGLADAVELHQARQSVAAARSRVPELERSLEQSRNALDVLVGRRPGTSQELPNTLPPVTGLEPAPAGVPAALLDRRPDLTAARHRLTAATAEIGVALANLYPSLSLTASGGITGDKLEQLTDTDGLVYSAVMSVLAPLFRGGQLRAEVDRSRAAAEEAAASYAGAVLQALAEVEDALVAEARLREQLEAAEWSLRSARAAERLTRDRYESGTGTLLELLIADRTARSAEDAVLATRQLLWEARVALHSALGGDWEAGLDRSSETTPDIRERS